MAKIENHKYSIEECFRECFYIVPDYQREYVWTEKEVHQLLNDINDELDSSSGREYFIGTVLVSPTNEKNHYDVIDGQQRLTTLFLLMSAMRKLFEGEPQQQAINGLISTSYTTSDGDIRESMKLEPRYDNAGGVVKKIADLGAGSEETRRGIEASGIRVYGSIENLINAYCAIFEYLRTEYEDKVALRRYWGYLSNNVVFIQISTDVSSALKIFETINERGVGLNPMDLLKNLLFTQVREDEFSRLKDEWKKITSPLEKHREKPLRFLRYFIMANYRIVNKDKDSTVREDRIYDWFLDKKNAQITGYQDKPFEFVRKLKGNVEQYINFVSGRGNSGESSIAMGNLKQLCGGAFSLHYILLLASCNLPAPLFDHFVRQLESFLFYFIFTKTPTKQLERNFSVWADRLREISEIASPDDQRQQLDAFIQEKFAGGMAAKEAELNDDLKRYTLNSMQKYRTKYLLSKLTQHVDMAYRGIKHPGGLAEYAGLQIEHILPNNPKAELRQEFDSENPENDYDGSKVRLGNLTLLERPLNVVAGNDFFERKAEEYKKCKHYLTSSIAGLQVVGNNSSINRMNEKLLSFSQWNAKNIEKRQQMLIDLAKEIWRVSNMEHGG